ncbi:presenilin-like protein [Phytophthora infestans T30-4]|uniref:Presenilin n=1 Tax=Phytophthora infestans (strain T30-4) TaxID=403677 RepID=D0NVU6_PHYIT|nr:presenilin-like protein [Phytophthora infestans T30-4]EEY66777.1 presenilin-like protein [Phytophthora infestans T30-4]|eukprot:XP_002896842.1 presenilin-like protein [Phytophthora infestans T30-4]
MGNARSDTRSLASVHYMSMSGDESNSTMYEEPLLDKSRVYHAPRKERQLQQESEQVDLGTVIHQLNSFFAVVWPVSNAIICSRTYMYYQDIDSSELSTAEKTEEALLNALLVIIFIAFLTFGVVLLYKCNGVHLFAWYCIMYSAVLLGLMGSKLVVIVLCGNLHWVIDRISLTIVMYNFAMVGVLSIFYQKGIPGTLERGYLIATSVIVAWQLAQLPEWSVWMLLLLLGFWDLFAVLTPVGPLRCLVDLIQEKGTPIPGLLFEAEVENFHIGERRRFATRDTVPEEIFIRRLLLAAPGESVLQGHGAVSVDLFRRQVHSFLYDQNSQCQNRSEELATRFERNQLRLWRNLYSYYCVDYVSQQQPYPDIGADKSIKLGLGDFIFYSVLVARASLHGFDVFAACFLSILVVRLLYCRVTRRGET